MIGPLIYVRLTRPAARGERDRAVHLVRVPDADSAPNTLNALCGKEFRPGQAERLLTPSGMPCFLCLVNCPGPEGAGSPAGS